VTVNDEIGVPLRRFWWLVLIGLVFGLVIGFLFTPEPGYTTSFRATVLIPGDTEDTGSSERPELMVLDDLGPFVESWAFAESVAAVMPGDVATEDIYGMLQGSRYSRVATVTVTGDDPDRVLEVANAAAEVFPQAVNDHLVAPGSGDATVQVIDPPRDATREQRMRWIRIGAIGLIGAAAVAAAVILFSPGGDRREGSVAVEERGEV
jgi:hypothetical protein